MPSSATTTLRLEKQAAGENSGTWGTKVNTALDQIDKALSGVTISTTGGTTTLTNVDYTADQAKALVLDVSGTLSSNATIEIPNASKSYAVINGTSGSYSLTVKTSGGSGKTITQGSTAYVYCDGANTVRYLAPQTVSSSGAPTTSSGAVAASVAVTPTGNISSTDAQAALAELQADIDALNTALGNKQALDSDLTSIAGFSYSKGTLIVGNGSSPSALSIGSDGLVLRAASGQSSGQQWAGAAPSGTVGVFAQTAAPTGWTKSTTHNNKALRIVSGTASSGGSTAFTSVFTSRTPTGTVGDTTLDITQIPSHTHIYGPNPIRNTISSAGSGAKAFENTGTADAVSGASGGGGSHTHTWTGVAMDFAVQYVDVILATCD